jgi:hypothetical protein
MSHANDWLQVSAGVCAAIGFALLSIGLFGDSKDSGVRFIRPILTGVGLAASLLIVGGLFSSLATYLPIIQDAMTGRPGLYTTVEIFLGLLLGYGLGLIAQPVFARRPLVAQQARVYAAISIVTLVAAGLAISELLTISPSLWDASVTQVMIATIGLGVSFVIMWFSTFASPLALKILGFFVTLLGIYLAVLPSLLSILGASSQ